MKRTLCGLAGVLAVLTGCATAGGPEPVAGYPALERDAAPSVDPQALGRPPEQLSRSALARVTGALQERGALDPQPLPGELRRALVAVQQENDLAPTGWVDADTLRVLGLPVDDVLPVEAGAGAYRSAGATLGGMGDSQVGGEPGPASPVPDAVDIGAAQPAAPMDPEFQFDEARRLRAASRELRGRAEAASGAERDALLAQASKADQLFRLHAQQLDEIGGESALAGLDLAPAEDAEGVARVEEGAEVRAAMPAGDPVELSPDQVERMQRTLWAEGFLHQAPTARIDEPTRQAVRAYQTAQGWSPTGVVDERTAATLIGQPESRQPQGLEPPGSPQPGGAAPPGDGSSDGGASPGEAGGAATEEAPAR